MLFGKKQPNLEDLKTLYGSLPEKIGPSGTPQGMSYLDILKNPTQDMGRYLMYKAGGADFNNMVPSDAKVDAIKNFLMMNRLREASLMKKD